MVYLGVFVYFGCHDMLMMGGSHVTIAVDWGAKPRLKQTSLYAAGSLSDYWLTARV